MSGRQKLERATQPNTTTHPISERRNGYMVYTPAFQCHFPNEKRKEWDISLSKKKSIDFYSLTQKQKKSILHTYILNVHTYI